ncbi:L-serine ammonia-lyase [Sutterella sp.]|uniref:L-serine ammonia-lyase n=1 Tax=Sutterella sp. TaxID=1981025 RepID=UPI0026E09F1A|nr:L-serine ammonia-lyase [Sutterella sp.]MDO5531585.1 L-serine ammonia-lyase [Sutterella sp.]
MISALDIFKIGIGPSSSHTVGPMRAGEAFCAELRAAGLFDRVARVGADVYGSLSLTGHGHRTDEAIILGLEGFLPDTVPLEEIPKRIADTRERKVIDLGGEREVDFPGIAFHSDFLPLHENGMILHAWDGEGKLLLEKTYYSIGGGFIVDEEHFHDEPPEKVAIPHPFSSAEQLLEACNDTGLSVSCLALENEKALRPLEEIEAHFRRVNEVMQEAIHRGTMTEGLLPGPLRVQRRAPALRRQLLSSGRTSVDPLAVIDWINMFALAVSEENAAGGRVVTAPTNGACGVIPAVLAYWGKFLGDPTDEECLRFFLAAAVIGVLFKLNASISGAEVGCQGEVGVACSMAAAGLTEVMGGNPIQVCTAAEIAMEHSLGLTCDPVNGQVQVPCIERNAIYAVKAVNAARMALRRTSAPRVPLDKVIATMYETGKDMNAKYRETSRGGLAIKVMAHCD